MLTFPIFLKSAGNSKGQFLKTPTSNGGKGNNLGNHKQLPGSKRALRLLHNSAKKTQGKNKGKENANPNQTRRPALQHKQTKQPGVIGTVYELKVKQQTISNCGSMALGNAFQRLFGGEPTLVTNMINADSKVIEGEILRLGLSGSIWVLETVDLIALEFRDLPPLSDALLDFQENKRPIGFVVNTATAANMFDHADRVFHWVFVELRALQGSIIASWGDSLRTVERARQLNAAAECLGSIAAAMMGPGTKTPDSVDDIPLDHPYYHDHHLHHHHNHHHHHHRHHHHSPAPVASVPTPPPMAPRPRSRATAVLLATRIAPAAPEPSRKSVRLMLSTQLPVAPRPRKAGGKILRA